MAANIYLNKKKSLKEQSRRINMKKSDEGIVCEGCQLFTICQKHKIDCHAKRILKRMKWNVRYGGYDIIAMEGKKISNTSTPINCIIKEKDKKIGDKYEMV